MRIDAKHSPRVPWVENVSSVSPCVSLKATKMGRRYIAQVADTALKLESYVISDCNCQKYVGERRLLE